jgi:hypothetical protein
MVVRDQGPPRVRLSFVFHQGSPQCRKTVHELIEERFDDKGYSSATLEGRPSSGCYAWRLDKIPRPWDEFDLRLRRGMRFTAGLLVSLFSHVERSLPPPAIMLSQLQAFHEVRR